MKKVTATINVNRFDTLFCNVPQETLYHDIELLPESADIYEPAIADYIRWLVPSVCPVHRHLLETVESKWVMAFNTFREHSVSKASKVKGLKYIGRTVKTFKVDFLVFDGISALETIERYCDDSIPIEDIKEVDSKKVLKFTIQEEKEEVRYVPEIDFIRYGYTASSDEKEEDSAE